MADITLPPPHNVIRIPGNLLKCIIWLSHYNPGDNRCNHEGKSVYVMLRDDRIRIRLSLYNIWPDWQNLINYMLHGWFYNNCVYFSRATIFDHTELAEYLISLVNNTCTRTCAQCTPHTHLQYQVCALCGLFWAQLCKFKGKSFISASMFGIVPNVSDFI